MTGVVDNSRPPYVMFERRAVEDRTASIAAGHYVSRDVDYVVVTRPGSRDTLEKEAAVWLAELREKGRNSDRDGPLYTIWYNGFMAAYKSWKDGEELPLEGTPIKGWPVLSPSAQKDLIAAGIKTVEDLANTPDQDLSMVGTGALSFKQKAQSWLAAAQDTGKVAEKLNVLTTQIQELTALTKAQAAELDRLRKVASQSSENALLKA